ncbi:unnamed protein product [Adineta steineri]|uniref:Protein-tyrosine-phosphatase n=1 Tax=Adineta steineri TaxID=433720 RepID=A0A819I654_9BILA|nr:unnamed protein product [Adineta steineri]CAF3908083.1 unnamed protein product [Adineta steineri]
MAEIVDSCCVPTSMAVQLTKPDKNNNTTANVDDGWENSIILPSEQCDVTEDGTDEKSESIGDSDDRRLSSGGDDDGNNNNNNTIATEITTVGSSSTSSNNETEVPINNESTINNTNTSTNNNNPTDPYKDFSGVDTESFIATTLRNNPKDRTLLLQLETLLQQFIQDDEQISHQFQAMNSYERMIVHRVAAFFGLDHNVDKNGQAVVVTKTPNTRIPNFSFQKCIPEDESTDIISGASTTTTAENPITLTNQTEIPTRRILRRHEKNFNHDHSQRNGLHDEYINQQISSTTKTQPLSKPYSERVNNYAETRARIFNDTSESSNTAITNKNMKLNQKQHSGFIRPSYRKQQQQQQQQQHQNSSHQHRSYTYQHSQQTTNNHMQQYSTGKTIDIPSHMLNTSTTRTPSIYSTQQPPSANLNIAQQPIYASMIASNPGTGSLRTPTSTSFYTQSQPQIVDYDYKQQAGGAHMYNYVPMIPPSASNFIHQQQQQQTQSLHPQQPTTSATAGPNQVPSQHGAGIPLPILVHQQPTGQIQYIFPAHALQQQQQQQQQPQPQTANPYPLTPDGQYVQLYRPDTLSIPSGPPTGPPPSIVDSNNSHHHQFSQNQSYHHHQISQQQPSQQQQQQVPPSQSNSALQPPPFVRIYPTGQTGNVSHQFAQATYQAPPPQQQTTFVQPGTIPTQSYMIPPPQSAGGVQTYPTYDNSIPYNTYGSTTAGKSNVNNNGTSVQYATNHLSTLNLQGQHDEYQTRLINNQQTRYSHPNGSTMNNQQRNFMGRPLVQSPNGSAATPRMAVYSTSNQQYRHTRPLNISNTDKQITSIENDPKSLVSTQQQQQPPQTNSDNMSLAGPAQARAANMGGEMSLVLPHLYLGALKDRTNSTLMTKNQIKRVLCIIDVPDIIVDKEYKPTHLLNIQAADAQEQDLAQYFEKCIEFIHQARTEHENILVHCYAGISRSATVVLAYLMTIGDYDVDKAIQIVKGARGFIHPNPGFLSQLKRYQSNDVKKNWYRLTRRYQSYSFDNGDVHFVKSSLDIYWQQFEPAFIAEPVYWST